MGARVAAWRRRASVAFIGVAAAFVVMTASAGPAQAFLGMRGKSAPEATPTRLTRMPEHIYRQREELQEFVSRSVFEGRWVSVLWGLEVWWAS